MVDESAPKLRYRLLETVRAYALDRARDAGELAVLRDAHADWWLSWLEEIDARLPADETVDAIDDAHADLVAMEWADGAKGLKFLALLGICWTAAGRVGAALEVADRLLFDAELEAQQHTALGDLPAAIALAPRSSKTAGRSTGPKQAPTRAAPAASASAPAPAGPVSPLPRNASSPPPAKASPTPRSPNAS